MPDKPIAPNRQRPTVATEVRFATKLQIIKSANVIATASNRIAIG
jgi:hypothetical protein